MTVVKDPDYFEKQCVEGLLANEPEDCQQTEPADFCDTQNSA